MASPADLSAIRAEAEHCTRCDLYRNATQTVFGSGPQSARVMLVGEQPGDVEDREGEVFVGPAGHLLDRALAQAGLERRQLYLTNAVKHFKWTPRGKRRLHKTPSRSEVVACHDWLDQELQAVQPALVVALGAIAATALLGPSVRVTRDRGQIIERLDEPPVLVTVHPSSVLRAEDDQRSAAFDAFVDDLRLAVPVVADGRRQG